jgi:hypothetical protein
VLVRITHDPRHARKRGYFFWRPLSIAARHENAAIRIHSLQSPNRRACVFIRALGHRAGVHDNNLSVESRPGALHSLLEKLPFQRSSVGLRSAAAKILYVEASHAPILTEWTLRLKVTVIFKDRSSNCDRRNGKHETEERPMKISARSSAADCISNSS